MTEILFFLCCLSAAIYVLRPLYERGIIRTWLLPEDNSLSYLEEKKNSILGNIKDLDFDFAIGKLSPEDYDRLRSEFKQEAAQVLEELDQMDAKFKGETAFSKPVKCKACQSPLPANAKFCPQCGDKQL